MALDSGTRLGPYEILGPLGAGGMGVVYRARDTRLERLVAIKVLPGDATSAQAFERFEREAKAIAALNHPGIARSTTSATLQCRSWSWSARRRISLRTASRSGAWPGRRRQAPPRGPRLHHEQHPSVSWFEEMNGLAGPKDRPYFMC